MASSWNLNDLISPITADEFFQNYWEQKPLLLTGRQKYDHLMTIKDVEFLLTTLVSATERFMNKTPWVRFINNKNELSIDHFLIPTKTGKNSQLCPHKVMKGYQNGNTIVLNLLQKRWEPVQKLCSQLQEIFGHPVSANSYLTPSNAQGFEAHYDPHDVFILQLEGSKLWKVWDSPALFPIDRTGEKVRENLGTPLYEVFLQPGDLFYIPRGWIHEASTSKTHSLHVTVGIDVLTWVDLLTQIIRGIPEFRRALPRKLLDKENMSGSYKDCSQHLDVALSNQENWEKAFQKVKENYSFLKTAPLRFGLTDVPSSQEIEENTLLRRRDDIEFSIATEGLITSIVCGDKKISGPVYIEPILEYIASQPSFTVKSLPEHLSQAGKINLIKSLMKTGLLEVVALNQSDNKFAGVGNE